MDMKTCVCGKVFEAGLGFIPGLDAASFKSRGKQFDPRYPLTPLETLRAETCEACARHGRDVISSTWMFNHMADLCRENARRLAAEQEKVAAEKERLAMRSMAYALRRPDDRGLVNQTHAEGGKPYYGGKHHRKPAAERRQRGKNKKH